MIARNEWFDEEDDHEEEECHVLDGQEMADNVAWHLQKRLAVEELNATDSEVIANLAEAYAALRSTI